jgi:hypothetical protein
MISPFTDWAGRFIALYDRFRAEILQYDEFLDSSFFEKERLEPNVLVLRNHENMVNQRSLPKSMSLTATTTFSAMGFNSDSNDASTSKSMRFEQIPCEHIKQARRSFLHLEALCLTREAKKSLLRFRIGYARLEGNSELMPPGIRWGDEEERDGLVARAGKMFSSRGRKSSFGHIMRARKSINGLKMSNGRDIIGD